MGGIAATGVNTDAVDSTALDRLESAVGHDTAARLATLFAANTMARMKTLERVVKDRDYAALAKLAHDFAGDSASLGAMELSKVARQIQADAKLEMRDAFVNLPLLLEQAQAAMELLARRYGPP